MKRLTALLLAILLCLCLPGCQSNGSDDAWDEAVGATPQPAETQAPSEASLEEESTTRKLVIAENMFSSVDSITLLANEFMAMNKDVEISFEYEMDTNEYMSLSIDEYAQRLDTHIAQLKTKLMTGEAPDIIYETSGLNLYAMTQSGVFQDLSEYWERDMASEDYFMPVVEAMRINGKQSIIPFAFNAYVVYVNRYITDALDIDLDGRDSITSAEMIEWYNRAREQGLMGQEAPMFFGQEPSYRLDLYSFQRSAYIDSDQREAHFDDPEVSAFLSELQSLPEIDDTAYIGYSQYIPLTDELLRYRLDGTETKVQNYEELGMAGNFLDYVQQGKEGLFAVDYLNSKTARDGVNNPCEYMAGPLIVTDSKGQVPVMPTNELAVSSSCKDPELAWEFIKYCISSRDTLDMGGAAKYANDGLLSINKANCRLQIEDAKDFWGRQPGYSNLSWYWAEDTAPEEVQAALDGYLDRPVVNYKMSSIPNAGDILEQLLTQRLIDPEQAAAELQDQAYIWLNE